MYAYCYKNQTENTYHDLKNKMQGRIVYWLYACFVVVSTCLRCSHFPYLCYLYEQF